MNCPLIHHTCKYLKQNQITQVEIIKIRLKIVKIIYWSTPFLYQKDGYTNFRHKKIYKWIVMI